VTPRGAFFYRKGQQGDENVASERTSEAELLVVGTAHVAHEYLPRYSWKHLEELLDRLNPDALCIEIRPEDAIKGNLVVAAPEMSLVGAAWAGKTGRPWYPVDWWHDTGPAEHRKAREAFARTPEGKAKLDRLDREDERLIFTASWRRNASITYRDFNSPEFSRVCRACHQATAAVLGEGPLDAWWNQRNREMCKLVAEAIAKHPGQRVTVLTGGEHKYWMDDFFAGRPGIRLLQVNEVDVGAPDPVPDSSYDARKMRVLMYLDNPSSGSIRLEPEGILKELDILLALDPGDLHLEHLKGLTYAILGDYVNSVASYRKSAADRSFTSRIMEREVPVYPLTALRLGRSYDVLGDRSEALDWYRKAIESLPEDHHWAKMAKGHIETPYRRS
jgi:hypothetical protein